MVGVLGGEDERCRHGGGRPRLADLGDGRPGSRQALLLLAGMRAELTSQTSVLVSPDEVKMAAVRSGGSSSGAAARLRRGARLTSTGGGAADLLRDVPGDGSR